MGNGVTPAAPVTLRRVTQSDVTARYLEWMGDPDVTRFLEARHSEHSLESLRAYVAEHGDRADTLLLAIIDGADGLHVGNVKVGPLDPHHGTADLGIMLGEKSVWGRGLGTESIRQATSLAFEELGARKLTASCYGGNGSSAAAFRRAGWHYEGKRPGQFIDAEGGVEDQLLFGTLAP